MTNTICDLNAKQLTVTPLESAREMNCAKSTRSFGLLVDVPHGLDTPRDSLSSMVPPFSAASTVTLFEEFLAGLAEDPGAQSTPHNTHLNKPMLKCPGHPSSLSHMRSEDCSVPITPDAETTTTSSGTSGLTRWSTRAVRPKVVELCKGSNTISPQSDSKLGSSGGNLRPLALLQYRDNNIPASPTSNSVRPLALGRRQKSQGTVHVQDENGKPDSASSRNKNLRPLKLVQFDTTKVRGILRKN